jgi:hypothetical protein
MDTGHAFFVRKASRVEKLKKLHLLRDEVPFIIEKNIPLGKIDYENFASDLGVERQFLEENKDLCRVEKGIWHSIYVSRRGDNDGILVMSDGTDRPMFTAFYDSSAADFKTAGIAETPERTHKNADRQRRMI